MRGLRSVPPPDWRLYRAKLEGCILGGSTKVGAKADLSKCVTQAGFEVDAGGEISIYTPGVAF